MKLNLKAGSAAFALIALATGATAVQSRSAAEAEVKAAQADAANATKALTKRDAQTAVRFAEQAVQLRPQDAAYRALLGKAYLAAGRYFSAKQAFADALSLDAGQGGVALNYALATTATGDFAAAHQILDANAASIAPADRGLALALAGDPAAGVEVLMAAARAPDVNAKTRQNLALTLALAGRWAEARQMALADLSPSDADARIMQWAQFARPAAASDQVSALLGVTPLADQGQPMALALVAAPAQMAEAPAPAPFPAPGSMTAAAAAPAADWKPDVAIAAAPVVPPSAPIVVAEAAPRPQLGSVIFAERHEVVQALPAIPTRIARQPVARPRPVAAVPTVASPRGGYVVQLGAFRGSAAARAAWLRVRGRHAVLAGKAPSTMAVANGLVRVSIGGLAQRSADSICRTVKAGGGVCFVRATAGDQIASWANGRVQVAAR